MISAFAAQLTPGTPGNCPSSDLENKMATNALLTQQAEIIDDAPPASLRERLGMSQTCAAYRLARDLEAATRAEGAQVVEPAFSPAVLMLEGMKPSNDAEAVVAAQLAALTPLMLAATGYALRSPLPAGFSHWSTEAVKLARASALMADTFARMRRGGEQEHN